MADKIVPKLDLIKSSVEQLVAISFPKSSSQVYPLAVNIAKGAAYYDELIIDKKIVHLVVFSKTREDAGRAIALINYIKDWKATQIFAGGKLIRNSWKTVEIIECFLEACACKDWTAHCHYIVDNPFIEKNEDEGRLSFSVDFQEGVRPPKIANEIDRYIFPCEFLWRSFDFQPDHPAKPQDQIQAAAVKVGCDWCPNFNPSVFKKIGKRKEPKDLFT
jgi:hypothetical protein